MPFAPQRSMGAIGSLVTLAFGLGAIFRGSKPADKGVGDSNYIVTRMETVYTATTSTYIHAPTSLPPTVTISVTPSVPAPAVNHISGTAPAAECSAPHTTTDKPMTAFGPTVDGFVLMLPPWLQAIFQTLSFVLNNWSLVSLIIYLFDRKNRTARAPTETAAASADYVTVRMFQQSMADLATALSSAVNNAVTVISGDLEKLGTDMMAEFARAERRSDLSYQEMVQLGFNLDSLVKMVGEIPDCVRKAVESVLSNSDAISDLAENIHKGLEESLEDVMKEIRAAFKVSLGERSDSVSRISMGMHQEYRKSLADMKTEFQSTISRRLDALFAVPDHLVARSAPVRAPAPVPAVPALTSVSAPAPAVLALATTPASNSNMVALSSVAVSAAAPVPVVPALTSVPAPTPAVHAQVYSTAPNTIAPAPVQAPAPAAPALTSVSAPAPAAAASTSAPALVSPQARPNSPTPSDDVASAPAPTRFEGCLIVDPRVDLPPAKLANRPMAKLRRSRLGQRSGPPSEPVTLAPNPVTPADGCKRKAEEEPEVPAGSEEPEEEEEEEEESEQEEEEEEEDEEEYEEYEEEEEYESVADFLSELEDDSDEESVEEDEEDEEDDD